MTVGFSEHYEEINEVIINDGSGDFVKCPCCSGKTLRAMIGFQHKFFCCGLRVYGDITGRQPPGCDFYMAYDKHQFTTIQEKLNRD